jgi:MoxR-like ATPase
MPLFTVQFGYDKRRDVEIPDGETVIGRELDCDIILDTPNASRHHAKVVRRGSSVSLEDLNSSNGTFLNSTPIDGKRELKHLDVVQIGESMFVYKETDLPRGMRRRGFKEGMKTTEYYTFSFMTDLARKIEDNISKVIKGKAEAVRNAMLCLFADGHLLIEDAPGSGKSILAQALAKSIQGTYKRIQFTPDMLPSDVTGISVYDEKAQDFHFIPGPIFGNIILADEINRTPPRTQASLLECMSESAVTIDGKPRVLPKPFFVVATQNPTDYHGTYPLPEPQLDRFLMRISIGYPSPEVEREIMTSQIQHHPLNDISYVATAMDVAQCQALARQIHLSDDARDYIVALVDATRKHPALGGGCSPRASLALMRLSQCLAIYRGRDYVIPRDIRELAVSSLAHRTPFPSMRAGDRKTPSDCINDILEKTAVPGE